MYPKQSQFTMFDMIANTPLIAVVDDDPVYLKLVGQWLREMGMRCLLSNCSTDLYSGVKSPSVPDAFLLDYHLGTTRETGLSLCRGVRLRYDRPVIMLTADSTTQTTVACLEAGAEQYITKPCSPEELGARIRVVLRGRRDKHRGDATAHLLAESFSDQRYVLADIVMEPHKRQVRHLPDPCRQSQLTEKESQLMQLFMQSSDQTVSRADAFYRLYNYEMEPENRSVDVLVTKLRKKIARVDPTVHIQSLRGQGYRLIAESSGKQQKDVPMASTPGPTEHDTVILDTTQLEVTLDSVDPELQKEFYEIFLGHVGAELKQIEQARPDTDRLRAMAHQLKSSSQSVGTRQFTQSLIDLEAVARSANPDSLALGQALNKVSSTWAQTIVAVTQRIAALSDPDTHI